MHGKNQQRNNIVPYTRCCTQRVVWKFYLDAFFKSRKLKRSEKFFADKMTLWEDRNQNVRISTSFIGAVRISLIPQVPRTSPCKIWMLHYDQGPSIKILMCLQPCVCLIYWRKKSAVLNEILTLNILGYETKHMFFLCERVCSEKCCSSVVGFTVQGFVAKTNNGSRNCANVILEKKQLELLETLGSFLNQVFKNHLLTGNKQNFCRFSFPVFQKMKPEEK